MPSSPAAAAAPCEIWIRQVGARRQAFYRHPAGGGGVNNHWRTLPVPRADKALRDGTLSIGPVVDAPVVPRETTGGAA